MPTTWFQFLLQAEESDSEDENDKEVEIIMATQLSMDMEGDDESESNESDHYGAVDEIDGEDDTYSVEDEAIETLAVFNEKKRKVGVCCDESEPSIKKRNERIETVNKIANTMQVIYVPEQY